MSQADDTKNNDKAATVDDNESDDDLCEVDIPFSIIDDDASDDDKAEQTPESSHTDKLNENIIMDSYQRRSMILKGWQRENERPL